MNINDRIDSINRAGQYQNTLGFKETFGPSIVIRPIFRIQIDSIQKDISKEVDTNVHSRMREDI